MFGIKLSEEDKKHWNKMGKIQYHLTPRYELKLLEKYGTQLRWWQRRSKKISREYFLICVYIATDHLGSKRVYAGIIDNPAQYDRCVKSVNTVLFWHIFPVHRLQGKNSDYPF